MAALSIFNGTLTISSSEASNGFVSKAHTNIASDEEKLFDAIFKEAMDRIDTIFKERIHVFCEKYDSSKYWTYMYRPLKKEDIDWVLKATDLCVEVIKKNVCQELNKIIQILKKESKSEKISETLTAKVVADPYDTVQSSLAEGIVHFHALQVAHMLTGALLSKDPSLCSDHKAHLTKLRDIIDGTLLGLQEDPSTVCLSAHYCKALALRPEKELKEMGKEADEAHRTIKILNPSFEFFPGWF